MIYVLDFFTPGTVMWKNVSFSAQSLETLQAYFTTPGPVVEEWLLHEVIAAWMI